jgi:predicted RNA-binding protein
MKRPTKLDHKTIQDLIYDIGQIQGKYPEKEYPIENKLIDVVWRRTAKSVPYMAFEIHISGNLHSDLIKLKHAYDLWNAIPVLITTEEKVDEARRWIEGSFHEVKNVFRILTIKDIQELYESKRKIKRLETKLGIF